MQTSQPSKPENLLSKNAFLERISQMYSTLDVHHLMDWMFLELKQEFAITGLYYHYAAFDINCVLGSTQGHTLEHHLEVDSAPLGVLSLTANVPFQDENINAIRAFVEAALIPLRNCLRYFEAVQASLHDSLTGIGNRAAFDYTLHREYELAERHDTALSIIMMDLDDFKKINDKNGHMVGDEVLKIFVSRIKTACRQSDLFFRYGGEEFVIILSHTAKEGAIELADRLCECISASPMMIEKKPVKVTVSIGVSSKTPKISARALLDHADEALYQAKRSGKNRAIFWKKN